MIVVADSSPLIYLSRVGELDVLRALFGDVVVPRVVWAEVVAARPGAPGVDRVASATWLRVPESEPETEDLGLDPGETAAILLAEALVADFLLIDERAGRSVAAARGVRVRGTLGVLIRAKQDGHIVRLRPVLDALIAQGFRLAPGLVDEALRKVGELADV